MNNIGTVTCCRCKKSYDATEALYYDSDEGVSFSVKKKGLGFSVNIFKMGKLSKKTKIVVDEVETINGIPSQVTVSYNEEGTEKQRTFSPEERICPHCAKQNEIVYLMYSAGYYPSYILCEMGSPATGKSTWLRAVCTHIIDKKIEDVANNCEIKICDSYEAQREKTLDPSSEAKWGYHAWEIDKNNTIEAMIYLIDMAGEYTKIKTVHSSEYGKLLRFLKKKVDGIFAFYDPRYINCDGMNEYLLNRNEKIEGNFENLFRHFRESRRVPPVGFIMTGADVIKKVVKKSEGVLVDDEKRPVLTENSPVLRKCVVSERALLQHIIIARDFINEATNIRVSGRDNEGYFLISSGEMYGEKEFDFKLAYNVEFPLLWMLNQLGLVEISD